MHKQHQVVSSNNRGEEPRPILFGRLELHVLVNRKLRGRARGIVTGTDLDRVVDAISALDPSAAFALSNRSTLS
jgi:hypothetical protein